MTLGVPILAQDVTFTNEAGASATFHGQTNLTYQGIDDGERTYDNFVYNSNLVRRVGLWIDWPAGENEFRFNFETSLGLKNTADTSQTEDLNWIDWQRTDIRKLQGVYSGGFGALWVGQGSMATDGAAEVYNSGTCIAGYVNLPDTAGAFEFRHGELLSDTTIGGVLGLPDRTARPQRKGSR